MSRSDRLLWGIVLVTAALVAVVSWLLLPPEKEGGIVRHPSTFYNVGHGVKAAYLVLDRLEYPVARLRRPLREETLDSIGVLFILKPYEGLRDFEMKDLETWIREGHTLVVSPGSSLLETMSGGRFEAPPPSQEPEDREYRRQMGTFFENWFDLRSVAPARDQRAEGFSRLLADAGPSVPSTELDASDPICAGIRQLTAKRTCRFASSPLRGPLAKMPARTLWKDAFGTVALRVSLGDGTIVALADPFALTNLGISEDDNALLLDNIVRELSRSSAGAVAFDEYHLGFVERDWSSLAMAKLALGGPWRWAVAQAALVGILALAAGAIRFGSPRDVTRKTRRQQREFAEAAGRLFDEAGAATMALETLCRHYRDRLCRTLHLEADADDARLSRAVRDRSGEEIAPLLQRTETALARRVGRQELLAIAQRFHRVAEALDHGS